METIIISAFPGCGKSYYYEHSDKVVLDSDSSKFNKELFPNNYISHIQSNIGKCHVILVSSHKEVRDALVKNNIAFTLVYPGIELKHEYISRFKNRGNNKTFIELLDNNWFNWIYEMVHQRKCNHVVLKAGEFLSNRIKTALYEY